LRKRLSAIVKILTAVAGALLVFHLVSDIGWTRISHALIGHRYLILGLTVVYIVYHVLRTVTLRICINAPANFWNLFGIRLAGEAIAYLAVGSIFGDTLKVVLARKKIPLVESATGVFAEKLIYHLSGICFILVGLLVALWKFGAHKILLYSFALMILVFAAVFLLMSSGVQPISRILQRVRTKRPRIRKAILETEQSLFSFRKEHPQAFLVTLILNFLSYIYSALEVLVILIVLGATPSFWDVWYYEAVVKAMNSAAIIVPANLGIFEASNVLVAKHIAVGKDAGLLVALIIRIRATLWSILGYFWLLNLVGWKKSKTV
jgi:hypothetical protein